MHFVAILMRILPQNLLSYLVGCLSRLSPPLGLYRLFNYLFVAIFRIDMSEAEKPLGEYQSIEEVFSRALRPGSRPLDETLIYPSDGVLRNSVPLEKGYSIHAKSLDYRVQDLLGENHGLPSSAWAWVSTLYLAPHNYHRVHAPLSGYLTHVLYVPGELWPVNGPFLAVVPQLFTRNERLVFRIECEHGGALCLVMVGSFNVGRMQSLVDESFFTNDLNRQLGVQPGLLPMKEKQSLDLGQEIGRFLLGSTVIMVLDEVAIKNYPLGEKTEPTSVKMGQAMMKG